MKTTLSISIQIDGNNITTLLHPDYRYFTIPARFLNKSAEDEFDIDVGFSVSDSLLKQKGIPESVKRILKELDNRKDLKLQLQYRRPVAEQVSRDFTVDDLDKATKTRPAMRCKLPPNLVDALTVIFAASCVNYEGILKSWGKKDKRKSAKSEHKDVLPWFAEKKESFTIDLVKNEHPDGSPEYAAVLSALNTYDMDSEVPDSFLQYVRNAMNHTSSSKVLGYSLFSSRKKNEEKTVNLYDYETVKPWKEVSELNDIAVGEVNNVIYMLYDQDNKLFYVGKATDLRTRLDQHRNKATDPIRAFTHFRYTILDEEYNKFIYFVENAAIHDCAALLNMPNRKRLQRSLQEEFSEDMASIQMVNRVDFQTTEIDE